METRHVRACTNCVRAKAKCSSSIADADRRCERCLRMNKNCQPSPPMRRHRTPKKQSPPDTSKLEEKLDGLVTLLTSQKLPMVLNPSSTIPSPETFVESGNLTPKSADGTVIGQGEHSRNGPPPPGCGIPGFELCAPRPVDSSMLAHCKSPFDPALEPSHEDAELSLALFRKKFVENLPFIVISAGVSAKQLRQERPLLWISIMTVASTQSTQQIRLADAMKEILSREVFIEGTRNMDLLLAILVYISWDRRYCYSGKPLLIALIQLALTVLYDLSLDKPQLADQATLLACDLKGLPRPPLGLKAATREERRAMLACFLISSSSFLRKGAALQWTKYSEECLSVIEADREVQSDALLVQLVKLRLIASRLSDLPCNGTNQTPTAFLLSSFQSQLQDFRKQIPDHLLSNTTLMMELHSTELSIHEIGLSQSPIHFFGQRTMRIDCLWACLQAVKSWMNVFLSLAPANYLGFSPLTYLSMAHCFTGMYRLSVFDHPDWDLGLVRHHFDMVSFTDVVEQTFLNVKMATGIDRGGSDDLDTFTIMASKIARVRTAWDPTRVNAPTAESSTGDPLFDFPLEYSDEDWLRDLIGPWSQ